MTHHYYYVPGKFNLDQMRTDANARTRPMNKFGNLPETTVIHMHAKVDTCVGVGHEIVRPGEDGPLTVTFTPTQEDFTIKETK